MVEPILPAGARQRDRRPLLGYGMIFLASTLFAVNGTVYHTYTVQAPDRFVAPYSSFLLERTPKPQPEEPRAWRKDEYPDA